MTGFLMNSPIIIPAVKGILSWFQVSTRITSQKLWWSSPHRPWRFDMTDSFCVLRLYYTFIPPWLKWEHRGPVDNARLSSSCRWIGNITIGSAWLESTRIAWFMTSNANVAIIQCYVINTLRNRLMPHHKPVSSEQLDDIVTQDSTKYFIKETGGMWDVNAVIKEAMKFAYCCLIHDLSVTKTISTQLCMFLCFATAVPSFLPTGIPGSSGFPFCTYFIAQKACLNTDRDLLVRKSTQVCLLPNACHQAIRVFGFVLFLKELSLGSWSFQICGNLGPVFSSPDALSVVAFFQSISRCRCLFILFPAHFILPWTFA